MRLQHRAANERLRAACGHNMRGGGGMQTGASLKVCTACLPFDVQLPPGTRARAGRMRMLGAAGACSKAQRACYYQAYQVGALGGTSHRDSER